MRPSKLISRKEEVKMFFKFINKENTQKKADTKFTRVEKRDKYLREEEDLIVEGINIISVRIFEEDEKS